MPKSSIEEVAELVWHYLKCYRTGTQKSWFKRFEVWDDNKKLKRLPTLLKGRAWAIFDSLPDTSTNTYVYLKESLLSTLSPDTRKIDETPMVSWDEESFVRTRKAMMKWLKT